MARKFAHDTKPPLEQRNTFVYRAVAATGRLIYVGISDDWRQRLKQHSKSAKWWPYVHHFIIERYETRAMAFVVESWALTHERPGWNLEQQEKHCPAERPDPQISFGFKMYGQHEWSKNKW